jgi:predicted metal-dependent hydrolase
MKKSVIRMNGLGSEAKFSDRINAVEETAREVMHVDSSKQLLGTTKVCLVMYAA